MRTLIFVATLLIAGPAMASQCGGKPGVPGNCKDLICVCDQYGQNCQWQCIGR